MQSFIPGKLIVIFQLLLPEVGYGGTGPLVLLLVLTLIAPMLTWASKLLSSDKPVPQKDSRHSFMANLLSAPAIFFWGLGTSDIGTVSLGWTDTASAASLAVATIVIPALDAFFANQRVEQWYNKWSGQSSSFSRKAHRAWVLETRKLKGQKGQKQAMERKRGGPGDDQNPPDSKKCACDGLCRNLDATSVAEAATGAHASTQSSTGEGNNAATRAMAGATEEKEGLLDDVEKQARGVTAMARTWDRTTLEALFGDGGSPATGFMHVRDRMLAMDDHPRRDLTAGARSSATVASEALLGDGNDTATAAMHEKDIIFAMAEQQRQRLTDMTAGARSLVAASSKGLVGDGKDAATDALQEKDRMSAMAENQGQQPAAGAHSSVAAASKALVGDGKDAATEAMQVKDTLLAMAENQEQQLTAGVRSSVTAASQSLLVGGKGVATAAMQEKDRTFAMAENQQQDMLSGARSSVTAASEALLGVGKDAATAAMQEKDKLFAMAERKRQDLTAGAHSSATIASSSVLGGDWRDAVTGSMEEKDRMVAMADKQRQDAADRAAVARSSVTAASEVLLRDGSYSPARATEEKQSMPAPDEKH